MSKSNLAKLLAGAALCLVGISAPAHATISETLYYTTFSGGENVWKVTGTYTGNGTVGNGTFTLSGDTGIAATPGADGLVLNPNNGFLLVGGQGNAIYQVNPGTGAFTTATPGNSVYELTVAPNGTVVWGGGSEGSSTQISSTPINPFGGAGSTVGVSGAVSEITHLTFVPGMPAGTAFYTSSEDDGTSPHFGTINLGTGVTTDILNSTTNPGAKWHGMEYDPYTGDLLLVGGNEVLQVDPTTHAIVSFLLVPGAADFDQGAVDGLGDLFWADNNGNLLFLDYSTTHLVGSASNFISNAPFKGSLDDFAPLVGAGGTNTNTVPEPLTLSLFGAGLVGAVAIRRRKRK